MKYKLWAAVGIMAILCIALIGCIAPVIPIVDPDDPIDPPATIPVAAFSFYSTDYPIQTDSRVTFDGSASYDPDGAIKWGKWDFGDGTVVEGAWVTLVRQWENGQWVWKENSVMEIEYHTYDDIGYYNVKLTVWDYLDNQSTVTRRIQVW